MSRRMIFLPLLAFVAVGAGLALLLGVRATNTTETEVIERVAALYVADLGGARTDCAARPAASAELWLVISCADQAGSGVDYFVDRFGRVVDQTDHSEEG